MIKCINIRTKYIRTELHKRKKTYFVYNYEFFLDS